MLRSLGVLSGHTEERIWYASWSLNGQYLASCGEDRVIRVWTSQDWEKISQVCCVAILEEGQSRTIRYQICTRAYSSYSLSLLDLVNGVLMGK